MTFEIGLLLLLTAAISVGWAFDQIRLTSIARKAQGESEDRRYELLMQNGSVALDGNDLWVADAQRYAEMASEDRKLRLSGYEVYRFGGAEFTDVSMDSWTVGERSEAMLKNFFDRLLRKHSVLQP